MAQKLFESGNLKKKLNQRLTEASLTNNEAMELLKSQISTQKGYDNLRSRLTDTKRPNYLFTALDRLKSGKVLGDNKILNELVFYVDPELKKNSKLFESVNLSSKDKELIQLLGGEKDFERWLKDKPVSYEVNKQGKDIRTYDPVKGYAQNKLLYFQRESTMNEMWELMRQVKKIDPVVELHMRNVWGLGAK